MVSIELFRYDHLVRTADWRVLGKAILGGEYRPGERVAILLLEVPKVFWHAPKGQFCWIDGKRYQVPMELPDLRIGSNSTSWLLNNFWLEPV